LSESGSTPSARLRESFARDSLYPRQKLRSRGWIHQPMVSSAINPCNQLLAPLTLIFEFA
jgi:hypothetical protein